MEIPTVFAEWSTTTTLTFGPRYSTGTEAMMGTLPGYDPDPSLYELQTLREAVVDCLDQLGAEDRFVIEALWFEGITVRALAERLGIHKSRTHRIAQRAVNRLGQVCQCHPTIVGHLRLGGAS